MKRIAFTIAALVLGAGAAFAATPATPSGQASASSQAMHAKIHHVSMRNDASANEMTKALNLLEAKGYASFSGFKADGKDYAATVMKNGHDINVLVDPVSGQVTTQS